MRMLGITIKSANRNSLGILWLVVFFVMMNISKSQAAVGDVFTEGNLTYTVLTEDGSTGTVEVSGVITKSPRGLFTNSYIFTNSYTAAIPFSVKKENATYSVIAIGSSGFSYLNRRQERPLRWSRERRDLHRIMIPDSVVTIGDAAFSGCHLTSITIPDSVTKIGANAFRGCTSLTKVWILGSAVIGEKAFSGCKSLTRVAILENVTGIGKGVFWGCDSLTNIAVSLDNPTYSSRDGVLFNKSQTTLICYPGGKEGKSYIIPGTVDEIESGAFWGCPTLTNISVNPDNPGYSEKDGVLFNKDQTALISYPAGKEEESYTIPFDIKEIREYAFQGCQNLTAVYYQGDVPVTEGDNIYADSTDSLISYYPKGNSSWKKAIRDGKWQGRKAVEWDPRQRRQPKR